MFRRITDAFRSFFHHEAIGGALLFASSIVALAIANSSLSGRFLALIEAPLIGHFSGAHIVNDWLMGVFFLVVGLEIKRELTTGEMSSVRRALLPAIAAAGGMIVPAVIFAVLNPGNNGWGIPTATDIAFVIGILSVLGRRVSPALAVFLVALAVFDDISGIALIALVYGGGIHPAIIGVVVAMFVPTRYLEGAIKKLHPFQVFLIMPLFALVNAGVDLRTLPERAMSQPLLLGTAAGLFFGKQLGIFGATALAVRLRFAPLPAGATWGTLYGGAILGGIGFTVSLFVAQLALPSEQLPLAKAGVLIGSLVSGVIGYVWIRAASKPTNAPL